MNCIALLLMVIDWFTHAHVKCCNFCKHLPYSGVGEGGKEQSHMAAGLVAEDV